MNVQRLMELASGPTNFRILRLLHENPMYSGDLSRRLSIDTRSVRVHLHKLRKHDFLDYDQEGRKHRYYVKTPFESPAHELIVSLVALSEPIRKRGENAQPIPVKDLPNQSRKSYLSYLNELLESYVETFVLHGSMKYGQKIGEDFKELKRRIESTEND